MKNKCQCGHALDEHDLDNGVFFECGAEGCDCWDFQEPEEELAAVAA